MNHFYASANNVVRDDSSAFHTFYFDPETGEPLKGVTRQGYSDESSWARGQAWGIYGIPLSYRKMKDYQQIILFKGMTNYFLNRLPEDKVSYGTLFLRMARASLEIHPQQQRLCVEFMRCLNIYQK